MPVEAQGPVQGEVVQAERPGPVAAPPARPLKRLKRFVRYLAVRAALWLVSLLPLGVASGLGHAFGTLACFVARGERRKALASLARAFPEKSEAERAALAKATFQHLGRCAFELACVEQLDARLDEVVEWTPSSRAVLEAALKRGKGVVYVTGHVGNWELMARSVGLSGYPAQTIAKETSDPRLTRLVEAFRARSKMKSIWRGHPGAAKQMLRALRNGEILGLLIDQDTKVQSVFVPFFGHLAATPRAPADLALRTGASVVLGFCQRVAPLRYRLHVEEVELPTGEDKEALAVALTARLSEGIERAIRQAPEQWVWMHQRWKTRPPT